MTLHITNRYSEQLLAAVSDIPIIGLERSCKLTCEEMRTDRYLIGIDKTAMPLNRLLSIAAHLAVPQELLESFPGAYKKANTIGIAYEGAEHSNTYRVYFEYWDEIAKIMRSMEKPPPYTIHIGYKWNIGSTANAGVTEYLFQPYENNTSLEAAIADNLRKSSTPHSFQCIISELINFVMTSAQEKALIMSEATEAEGSRLSFDLNCYKTKLKLRDVDRYLLGLAEYFRISETVMVDFVEKNGEACLGHLSAGAGAKGREFFTFYFDDFQPYLEKNRK